MRKKFFQLDEVFNIKLGKPIHRNTIRKYSVLKKEGFIPYVTRKTTNNGVEFYVERVGVPSTKIQKAACITIGAEGIIPFYQDEEFVTGNKVYLLYSPNLNLQNALYLSTVLKHEIQKRFNYGRGLVRSRLEKLRVFLPAKNNEPLRW